MLCDGNFACKPSQKYGTVEERDDNLELVALEFCILVKNLIILATFHRFFLLSSCSNFYKLVKLSSSLPVTLIGIFFSIRKCISL